MAAKINDFGPISQGYDRAQIGVAPPINNGSADVRPLDNASRRRQSLHVIIGDNLPLLLTHPRRGFRKVKIAVGERRSSDSSPGLPNIVPTLAPAPPVADKHDRLHTDPEEKPAFPSVKEIISHPVSTVKSFAADKSGVQFSEYLAKAEVPHSASVNLLMQDHENSKASTTEEAAAGLLKLTQLKHLRQDAFVRWTVDRHVREVRKVLLPSELPQQAESPTSHLWTTRAKQLFERSLTEHAQFYIDDTAEWPLPNRKILTSSCERIVVASTQIQNWYMDIRAISHWDNPRKTSIYAAGYTLLVFTGHVPSIALLLLMYNVWKRRNEAPDLKEMWETIAFSEDKDQTPRHLNELITQYGTQGWVDHVIDRAGPALYIKLEHVADILEIIQNFYEWRDPVRTTISLCKLAVVWLLITVSPTWLILKTTFFFLGFNFFVLAPIGYHYPQFKLLVAPSTWTLWRVPTHADWAIARLQAEGRAHLVDGNPEDTSHTKLNSEVPMRLTGTYECMDDPRGILDVTTASITFSARKQDSLSWAIQLSDLKSVKKIAGTIRTNDSSGLQFGTIAGLEFKVMGLEKRDEVFSQIIGYSDTQWKRVN